MNKQLFSNNATSLLASALGVAATQLVVTTGEGVLFQTPIANDFELITVTDGTAIEIIKCTGRSGDVLTIVRAQENTTAATFALGSTVYAGVTKNTLELLQLATARIETNLLDVILTDGASVLVGDTGNVLGSDINDIAL